MAVAALSPISLTPIFDNNGALVRNARLYFYRPGTLDPVTVYQDQELGAPHTQPIVTGGSGRVPPVYVGDQPQRIRIFDNANQLVEDIPWLPGATESTGGGGEPGGGGGGDLVTGDVIWSFSNGGVRSGFVRLNGGTIGTALSGATERANDDAHDLFVFLWGQDQGELLTITPGRGASAESDWLANKQLALPDGAGMVLGGITTMGRPARDVLTGVPFSLGGPVNAGARMGTALHTLVTAQIPAHNHGVTDPGHTHGATQAAHNHAITDPGHNHGVNDPTHAHSISDPGHSHYVNDPGHNHSISDPGHDHTVVSSPDPNYNFPTGSGRYEPSGANITRRTSDAKTGISINARTTGIWLSGAGTGIGIYGAYTGISIQSKVTGISLAAAQPAITVASVVTGVSIQDNGGGQAHNNVQPTLLGTFYMKL
jgi:microcystin-dependent protein